jgi:hypothetical protein
VFWAVFAAAPALAAAPPLAAAALAAAAAFKKELSLCNVGLRGVALSLQPPSELRRPFRTHR